MPYSAWLVGGAALFGLAVGSYLNVLIHRLPRGESTVLPRSRCPACGALIRARDNVPVLGWLLLSGRCRDCGAPISWRYPVVEAVTAALFAAVTATHGAGVETLAGIVFCALLVVLAFIDLEHHLLPDRLTLPGILVGWSLQAWLPGSWSDAVIGALAGAGLLILLINVWFWLRDEEGMGLGDVNLLAMIGAFVGWKGMIVALFTGAVTGAAVGLGSIAFGKLSMGSKLPFGTFLALGALVAYFYGEPLVAAYAGLLSP